MLFPFSIRYSALLSNNFSSDRNDEALTFIEHFIAEKTGDDVIIEDSRLTFKSKFFNSSRGNTNILVPIEKGVFTITEKSDNNILTYEFYMYHLFIVVTVMSVFISMLSQQVLIGIICFLWIGGMNWFIAIIRHKMMLTKIVKGIDILINKRNNYK